MKVKTMLKNANWFELANDAVSGICIGANFALLSELIKPHCNSRLTKVIGTADCLIVSMGLGLTLRNSLDKAHEMVKGRTKEEDHAEEVSRTPDPVLNPEKCDVDEVMGRFRETLDKNGVLTLADYYLEFGLSCIESDLEFGWASLDGFETIEIDNKWTCKTPEAVRIESLFQ